MSHRRTVPAIAGAIAALFLTACSNHPGSAATVGDESISVTTVDDVASALCAVQSGGGSSQQLASRGARQGALDVLISSDLSRQYGEAEGVVPDQEQVDAALSANEQNIKALPAEHRAIFRDTLRNYAEGQLMLIDIGRQTLTAQGKANATDQQAVAQGTKLRNAWAAKNLDVSVDPRYGEFANGALVSKSGSLSVAQSERATDGDSPDPSAGWVSELPASQKCAG
ncbi:MAG: hypothetical protein HOQ22_05495 [Nocardioidaceae bacterium]|nr:hypothetical protein [Nocardioidaceae bacterium]NUS50481.1 hypothetical protein [Nocardioidaceae bacterium]